MELASDLSSDQRAALNAATAACAVAMLTLLPVAAHQLGLLDHLPDPPSDLFDSDRITESKAAHPLGIPDSLLGLGSYAATLALLLASRRVRIARQLLRAKLTADSSAAAFNAVRQIVKFRRLCSWCTGTAIATAAVVHYGRKALRDD
jgi:uncharacterized membrane protein